MKKIFQISLLFFITSYANANEIVKTVNKPSVARELDIKIAPATPNNFSVNKDTDSYNSLYCSWSSVSNITVYRLYYQRSTDGSSTPYANFKTINFTPSMLQVQVDITLTDTDIPMPKNYLLYVVAVNASGIESAPSAVIYYDSPPPAPAIGTLSNQQIGRVDLNYTNSDDTHEVFGYYIVSTNKTAMTFDGDGLGNTANAVTITGLHPNQSYAFNVYALDQYGNISPASATSTSIIGLDYCKPATLQPLCLDANSYISRVQLGNINNPSVYSSAATFTDYYSATGLNKNTNLSIGSTTNVLKVTVMANNDRGGNIYAYIDYDYDGVFEDSELIVMPNITYKGAGKNSMTANVPITFVSDPIKVPITAYTGNVRMRILYQRFQTGTFTTPTNNCMLQTVNNSATDVLTGKGEIEDYYVQLINPTATTARSSGSNAIPVKEVVSNLPEKLDATDFKLFPNPVSGDFMNITAIDNNTPYAIYNTLGQEVSNGKVNNSTINVAALSKGSYILQVQVNDQRIVKQFIKQ
ncbi:T9SS type A sorting domain-containing protein [Flavobacterium sp.]|uniref:T9SS type A sorting domain-containing protein n=1 Tax=Flavobacterium sp. TaxID=239 RepID=UPI00375380CB